MNEKQESARGILGFNFCNVSGGVQASVEMSSGVMMQTLIGFDSAWTDKKSAPGAICALAMYPDRSIVFHPPRLATFDDALAFIDTVRSPTGATLVALDQPTIVQNQTSMRPVERGAASLVSWMGGDVQPSNRGKVGMFCDASPIWSFLTRLGATEMPFVSREATSGLHLIEVFPALALAALEPSFFNRLGAPHYNPVRRKTFRIEDWRKVAETSVRHFRAFGVDEAAICAPMKSCAIGQAKQTKTDLIRCFACLSPCTGDLVRQSHP